MPNDIVGRWLWQVGGLEPAIRRHLRHMSGIPVKHRSHLHHCSGRPDSFAKAGGAIGWGENRLRHIAADLAPVDIPGRYNLYIGRTVAPHLPMAETSEIVRSVCIIMDALHQRTGAITDAHQAYGYIVLSHDRSEEYTSELQSLMRISYAVFCL